MVREQVVSHLQNLVRLNSTNPPGNETPVAEYLAHVLRDEGIDSNILEAAPGRGNLVAKIKGDGRAAPLLIMAHLDTVPSEPDKWSHEPLSGDLANGFVWGRGTLDTKNLVAMELMVMLLIKRSGKDLARDLIFMGNADEETGGRLGAGWLVKEYPDLIRSEYAINEGGGFGLKILGRPYFTCQIGEKGTARFALRAHGRSGHASQPHWDNAVLKLARAVEKIGTTEMPLHVTETARRFIEGIAENSYGQYQADLRGLLDSRRHRACMDRLPLEDGLPSMLHAMLHNTVTPTMLNAGTKINVIPSVAEARCDARILPGQTARDLENELAGLTGNGVEIEFLDNTPGFEGNHETVLFDTITNVMMRHRPDAKVLPYLVVGATDARHVRKLGTKVLGFSPMFAPSSELDRVHGHNERISVDNLEFGTRVLYDVVTQFCMAG